MSIHHAALSVVVAVVIATSGAPNAEARPKYNTEFRDYYRQQFAANKQADLTKCAVCHDNGPDKRGWNHYGAVVKEKLRARNEKDLQKIRAAFDEAAKEPSAIPGYTFGELIEAGIWPASKVLP